MNFFKSLLRDEKDGIKDKLSSAIREIEIHRMNLLNLKDRLESRCKDLLEIVKKESELKEYAKVYETEYLELEKVFQIVSASELALSRLILRLETLKDLGDAVYHLNSALKAINNVDKSVSGLLPSIERNFDEINSTLNETIIKLQITSPSFYLDPKNEEELIEEAIKYVEEKAMQEKILTSKDELVNAKRVALLATVESIDETEPEFIPSSNSSKLDESMLNYIYEHKDKLNPIEASTLLNAPLDGVKQSILRLLHEGKVSFKKKAESERK
ncbi:MAG: hypothetical protein ACUVTD_01120 [Nitrososphaerales archaeon]